MVRFSQRLSLRWIDIGSWTLFLALALLHYFSARPLWMDELFLLDNIQRFSYSGLLGLLDHSQAFPRVYLMLIKAVSQPFGYPVPVLRLFPLVAMILAFWVWQKIFRQVFIDKTSYALALTMMGGSYFFGYYAAEFKPYSMDVLVAGIFTFYLLGGKQPRYFFWLLPFCLLFSYAAIFFMGILILNFLAEIIRGGGQSLKGLSPKLDQPAVIFFLLTGLVVVFVYLTDLRYSTTHQPLIEYWESYFICTHSFGCFMESFWEGLRRLATTWYGKEKVFIQWSSFLIPFFLYGLVRFGLVAMVREKFKVQTAGVIGAFLLCELFILSIIKKYPFTGERLTLFLSPLVFYFILKSIEGLKPWKPVYDFFVINIVIFLLIAIGRNFYLFSQYYH